MTETDPSLEALARVLSPKSRWSADMILEFLRDSRLPLRVSSLDRGGSPHITSLWFRFVAGRFLCCTQQHSVVCRQLRRDPRTAFEVAVNTPPYRGLSGQGTAKILDDDAAELLNDLADHYLEGRDAPLRAWLLSRITTEAIIEITPRRITSWDFGRRMSSADFPV